MDRHNQYLAHVPVASGSPYAHQLCMAAAHGLHLEAEVSQQPQHLSGRKPFQSRHQRAVVSKLIDKRGFAANPREAGSSSLMNSPTASRRLRSVSSSESP